MVSRKISADFIFTGSGKILDDHVILLSDNEIIDIQPLSSLNSSDIEHFPGWIIPGFINTHCHLELSHMKDVLPTGTGLIPFITGVVTQRGASHETIQEACKNADKYMWDTGVVAVGDISNTLDSFETKKKSKINYYTFVEAFDLMQRINTQDELNKSKEILTAAPDKKSLVPHAPYSCTSELLHEINKTNQGLNKTISIHNQETIHENNFFINKTGDLVSFYESFGLDLSDFKPNNKTSIHYLLEHLDINQQYLFVHNTITDIHDIDAVTSVLKNTYWATCANANLFIENNLPDYSLFAEKGAKMTIGTDSLASNWQLSIWDELNTIKRYNSYLSNELLLTWATINGAYALQMSDEIGSIDVGKSPGLVHINTRATIDQLISPDHQVHRIL